MTILWVVNIIEIFLRKFIAGPTILECLKPYTTLNIIPVNNKATLSQK